MFDKSLTFSKKKCSGNTVIVVQNDSGAVSECYAKEKGFSLYAVRGGEGAKPSPEVEQCGEFPNCIRFDGLLNILQSVPSVSTNPHSLQTSLSVCTGCGGDGSYTDSAGRMELLLT